MLDKLIGNTPMIKIKYRYQNKINYIYAKLEYYNYTGSIKDRIAYNIITKSKALGLLKDGQPIIEATSGNTGISFAALGAYYNHPVFIFMPAWASKERISIMQLYGAKVYLFNKEEGGFKRCIEESKKLAQEKNGFLANQFNNVYNVEAHYLGTAPEIIKQVPKINAFVSGVGTGGTLMGIAKRLKEKDEKIQIVAVEPSKMPLLSQGKIISNHKIEGIGDDFIPQIVDKRFIDKVITINDEDAINMSRLLAKRLGLGVGISSGANFLASVLLEKENVVTIFADDFKKYLTTDLVKNVDDNPNFISNKIELLALETIN